MGIQRSAATFSFLEVLDRTFRLYRDNFATIVGIVASIVVPISLIQIVLSLLNAPALAATSTLGRNSTSVFSASQTSALCLSSAVTTILALLQIVLLTGAVTYVASESYLGRKVTIGEAFRARRNRFTNLGCGYVIFYVVLVGLGFVVGLAGAFCTPVWAALGLVAYVGVATYAFLAPVLVLEDVGTTTGVNRSWSLGKARFWTVLGLVLVLAIITTVINLAFTGVAQFLLLPLRFSGSLVGSQIVNWILTSISSIFLAPILPIGLTLLYHDSRNRLEGLDFALEALGSTAHPSDVISPAPQSGLTSRDLINVGIILGVTVLVVLIAGSLLPTLYRTLLPGLPALPTVAPR